MKASITLGSGAEDNSLARTLGQRIEARVQAGGRAARDFQSLRAAVAVVAVDQRLSVTLRFDHGVLTIHDGLVGLPDITLCSDMAELRALSALDVPRWATRSSARAAGEQGSTGSWRRAGTALASGELRIYGLWSHPRLALRLWRLLRR